MTRFMCVQYPNSPFGARWCQTRTNFEYSGQLSPERHIYMATDQELKISRMTKRSMNKKIFSRPSYKLREFVLTPFHIKYFEVSGGNRGKEKGRISLAHVKYVEKVLDDDLDNKKNVLQIAYVEDPSSINWFLLYIVAPTLIERDDWISLIRFYTRERGACFLPRYHPGVWRRPGRYSCCDDINRRSLGCQHTTDSGSNTEAAEARRFSAFPGCLPPVTSTEVQTPSVPPLGGQQSVAVQAPPPPPTQVPQQSVAQPIAGKVIMATPPAPPPNPVSMFTQQQLLFQQQQQQQLLLAQQHKLSMLAAQPHLQQQQQLAARRPARLPQSPGGQSFDWLSYVDQRCLTPLVFVAPKGACGIVPKQQGNRVCTFIEVLRHREQWVFTAEITVLFSCLCLLPAVDTIQAGFLLGRREENEKTVIAVHNYNPVRENQLPLQKGEKYYVVNDSNAQWWYVRNMAGQSGYVPTNYIHKPNSLNSFDWYYKDITRQQAEAILLEENREGCFLVRDSVSKKNTYTLSVTSKDPDVAGKLRVHHYHIHRTEAGTNLSNGHTNGGGPGVSANGSAGNSALTNGGNSAGQVNGGVNSGTGAGGGGEAQFYLSEKHAFPTISEVIHYHKHNSGGLVVRLRSPPVKDRESPVTAGMGLDEFELDPAELQIDPEPIGKGQFGVVKRGKFRNIPVAVKQMVENAMNEEDFIEEAKNMRLVSFTAIVLVSQNFAISVSPIGSLRDFLRQRQSQFCNRPVVLADICAQVGNGMAYLEREQFVHRDLAARNCLVKSVSRNSVVVKVADFGMARFLLDNVYEPSAGTKFPVRWAAPEVFQSVYTDKADVWSFGVLMWEVFTYCLENPYHGMNNSQVYQFIVDGGRLHKPAVCPDRIYVLMLECWQHDRNRRPAFEYICQKIGDYLDQNCEN
ncbi:Tyrosine-protein kinase Btk29A [Echinococcus granulosus]|uniref:Tyrosine-protein kinase n=1 Tax=Echinococcus granulosus TaxID=6210 RepID=W6V1R7_ECHGR|nr:Tyrosine-protein kinase Btk29A [Echinococcus granulosus]EUB59829.1 Tyrosine-protein kinase Btk29A [Echinococcus granulosus]